MASWKTTNNILLGVVLAITATIIWSGNFVVARGLKGEVAPVALSFFRWLTATVLLLPIAARQLRSGWSFVQQRPWYFFWTSLLGIALFNTFVYVAGHSTTAINMALIGTTSSPLMSVVLARYFLNEPIGKRRLLGMGLCVAGILFLLSKGNWTNLLQLRFTSGDAWMLLAAFCFACYNILVRKRNPAMPAAGFLFYLFAIGTLLLLPAYLVEAATVAPVQWNTTIAGAVLYLGLGTSVIAFLLWNRSIRELGAGRTALFGNLIPVFASVEAVLLLGEQISWVHLVGFLLVGAGLLIDNLPLLLARK